MAIPETGETNRLSGATVTRSLRGGSSALPSRLLPAILRQRPSAVAAAEVSTAGSLPPRPVSHCIYGPLTGCFLRRHMCSDGDADDDRADYTQQLLVVKEERRPKTAAVSPRPERRGETLEVMPGKSTVVRCHLPHHSLGRGNRVDESRTDNAYVRFPPTGSAEHRFTSSVGPPSSIACRRPTSATTCEANCTSYSCAKRTSPMAD